MAKVYAVLSEEAHQIALRQIGYRARGIGAYLSALVVADEARREARIVAQHQRERVPTKAEWDATGNRTD